MLVGVLNDTSGGPPATFDLQRWLSLAVEELSLSGRLDAEVAFVHSWGPGLPYGTAAAVERAYRELVDAGALLIVGPAVGDNALVATPLADHHRVPTINWAGSERGRGTYMFQVQVGSHEDEPVVLTRYLSEQPVDRIGVVYDRSPIGRRYLEFFRPEAENAGVSLAATASVDPVAGDAASQVEEVLASAPDCVVYLGLGFSAPAVARAFAQSGWDGLRVMNTSGMRGHDPSFGVALDGWVYVDMYSDGNSTLRRARDRSGMSHGPGYIPAVGYDIGRLVAEALARAPERTRNGVRDGLEQVKGLPAAQGHEGTLLGFGHLDHGALHGRFLVLRRWQAGKSVEV